MPLRDLPTESTAAAALLRTEELRHRRTLRRTQWQSAALACLAVGAAVSILIPGSSSTGCYLWRATTQPVSGRGAALVLPVVMIVLLLADRLAADRFQHRRQVRGYGAIILAFLTAITWTGLVSQGRSGCSTSPTVIGTILCGGLATALCAYWATRSPTLEPVLAEGPESSSEMPLDQSDLRATFLRLTSLTDLPNRSVLVPVLTGSLAALLILTTVLPWRELIDPVSIGPGGSEAGLARTQLWELPYAENWALLLTATALTALVASIATLAEPKPNTASGAEGAGAEGAGAAGAGAAGAGAEGAGAAGAAAGDAMLVLRAGAVATGAVVIAGDLAALLRLPSRLPEGVGYRPGIGAWLALTFGILLLAIGTTSTVLSVRRHAPDWSPRHTPRRSLGVVAAAGLVAVGAGLFVPGAAGTQYKPEVVAGSPHRLLDLRGGQLVDRLGMRVAIGTSDPLDSIAGALDGTPGEWLLGRTGSEGSTVFEYRDGVALPRVALSHGVTPPALLGVSDNKLFLLAGGAGGQAWAILAVPLNLVAADVSLSHKNSDGSLYVTPGIDVVATGQGPALTHRNADRSIVVWGSTKTWQIPANQLRPGLELKQFLVDPGPGAPGNASSSGPDGTTAWRTSETGLALLRPGGKPQELAGVAPAGCALSSDVASSSLTVDAFAVDVRGNVWLGGSAPAAVLTPDGVLRQLPGQVDRVESIEARPDGSVLLGVAPGGGDQVLEISDAAASAASYPALPEPTARCDRRKPADGSTQYRATVLPLVPAAGPPVSAEGAAGRATTGTSTQLALDAQGRLIRLALPSAAQVWAPDGQGGVWWTAAGQGKPSTEVAVHVKAGKATVVRDPQQLSPNQRGEFAPPQATGSSPRSAGTFTTSTVRRSRSGSSR
ncbi:hypothetical protein GCM10009744_24830 [Kribbella alba]|uniref:Uncharacterized protein n=1 Tax=Kribbella alba TaxID=190197 RepID=A0ABN2F8G6_9ACTN